MNRLELENKRLENFHKLDWQQFRPKYNALEVDINNGYEHEKAKFRCLWLIRKGVPAFKLQDILMGEEFEENFFINFKHEWERPVVITEARFKEFSGIKKVKTKEYLDMDVYHNVPIKRRADIFILDTGECIEIETNHKIKKEDSIVVYI